MTMIASTANFGFPIVMGDLLISDSAKRKGFILPSVGQNVLDFLPQDSSRYPFELFQKIYIVKQNVCVGFCGPTYEIKKIYPELVQFCKYYDEIDETHIKRFAENYKLESIEKLSTLIVLVKKPNVMYFTFGHWMGTKSKSFDTTLASGSGAPTFMREVKNLVWNNLDSYPPTDYGVSLNLGILCKLLTQEIATLESITQHFGAGFEMVYYDGNSFKKLSEFALVTLYTEPGNLEKIIPKSIFYYKYEDEILTLNCCMIGKYTFEQHFDKIIFKSDNFQINKFFITPFNVEEKDVDVEKFKRTYSFKCNLFATGLICMTSPQYVRIGGITGHRPNNLIIYDELKSIEIHYDCSFLKSLIKIFQ